MNEKSLFPNEKIIVTKHFDVHQDWDVPIPGFFIIATTRKIKSIEEFNEEETLEFIQLIKKVRKGMRELLGIQNVYLFQDESTKHNIFHIWILPKYDWMNQFGEKIQSIRPIIEYSKQNMTDIKSLQEVRKYSSKMREYMKK